MDSSQVKMLRAVLAETDWLDRADSLAAALRVSTKTPGGLLLVGTPDEEPWHLAAHLDDESRYAGIPQIAPTLVRWAPPPEAPPHLSFGIERLEAAKRGETLFVVAPATAPVPLLERVDDARTTGATVVALGTGDRDLEDLAHESLVVPCEENLVSFDGAQHLVSYAAGLPARRRGLRARLARMLDTVSGPHT